MATPWAVIENAPEAAAALTWKRWLGPAFDAVAAVCLRETQPKREIKEVPCENGCDCNHRVRKDGDFWVGRCVCDEGCYDIPLTKEDVSVMEFRGPLLGRAIADALECEKKFHEFSLPRTWQVAEAGAESLPVVVTVQAAEEAFRTVVAELLVRLPGGFILVAPTKTFCNAAIQELLSRERAGFFALDSNFTFRLDGKLEANKLGAEWFARVLGTAAVQTATTAVTSRNSFTQAGSHWDVTFNGGNTFHIPHTLGAEYLNHLLHHPSEAISAYDLEMKIRPDKAKARTKDTVQNNLDAETIREYLRQLEKMRTEREEASEDGDVAKVDQLDADIEAIASELKKNGQAPDAGERSRGNVSKAVAAVLRKLRVGDPDQKAFAQHLEQFISMGYECIYNQPQENRWG